MKYVMTFILFLMFVILMFVYVRKDVSHAPVCPQNIADKSEKAQDPPRVQVYPYSDD